MKRSTLVFASLLAALFIAPFVVAGSYYFFLAEDAVVLVDRHYRVLRINNPSLQSGDVVLSTEDVREGTLRSFARRDSRTLYYKGKKKYLPDVWDQEDTLYVGKALGAGGDFPLALHVTAGKLDAVFLNGAAIYERHSGQQEP